MHQQPRACLSALRAVCRLISFAVTGLEHSGTTLISDLFRQAPGVDAGFEVGVLLAASPREFPALDVHTEIVRWGWGVDPATLDHCCDTDDFATFYERLFAAATVLKPGTTRIFDKTPRYLLELDTCMQKVDVPFIVAFKDPRASVFSDWRRAGAPNFLPWFYAYARAKLTYTASMYAHYCRVRDTRDPRICLVRLEDLCAHTHDTCARMWAHVGLDYNPAYATIACSRYENTRPGGVSADVAFEYRTHFDAPTQAYIARVFRAFDDWFYD